MRSRCALSRVRTKSRIPLAGVTSVSTETSGKRGAYSKILDGFHDDGSAMGTPDGIGGCGPL